MSTQLAAPAGRPAMQGFRQNARQRLKKIGTITYAAAQKGAPLFLPKIGLLSRLIIQFRGTVTLSGAGALADLGPWNLISRLKLNSNLGAASLVDMTGYGLYLMSFLQDKCYHAAAAGIGATTPDGDLYGAPVASGANTWVLTWVVPVALNQSTNCEVGLINMQAPEVQVNLDVDFGALLDPATLVTATSGSLHVYMEYFEVPDPRQVALPPQVLVRTLEDRIPITGTGETRYTIPRQGALLQLLHWIQLNGSRNHLSIDSMSIVGNKTDTIYDYERQAKRLEQRIELGADLPTGSLWWDFFHAEEGVSEGDLRDAFDTEEISTLESVIQVASGTTLGSNNNFLSSIRRIIQLLQ